jgi:hypothetical protein
MPLQIEVFIETGQIGESTETQRNAEILPDLQLAIDSTTLML